MSSKPSDPLAENLPLIMQELYNKRCPFPEFDALADTVLTIHGKGFAFQTKAKVCTRCRGWVVIEKTDRRILELIDGGKHE